MVSDADAWDTHLTAMENSPDEDVREISKQIWNKQRNGPREFQSIYGTLSLSFSFLGDPNIRASMDGATFSFGDICRTGEQPHSYSVILPAEYVKQYAGYVRLLFAATSLTKYRHPGGRRLHMFLDEMGQLGRVEAALNLLTYGRGANIIGEFIFQDIGQIARIYGNSAVQTFFGSCQRRRIFGIRDNPTAQLISQMLGYQTLEYDDPAAQEAAEHRAMDALRRFTEGADAREAAADFVFFEQAAHRKTKMQRLLMSADELLNMPENRMIAMISGKNLSPIYAHKYPYYTHRDLVGLWLPNPYHPPLDQVMVPDGRRGRKPARVITRDVPPELVHFPQYANGTLRYVEGYYPF